MLLILMAFFFKKVRPPSFGSHVKLLVPFAYEAVDVEILNFAQNRGVRTNIQVGEVKSPLPSVFRHCRLAIPILRVDR